MHAATDMKLKDLEKTRPGCVSNADRVQRQQFEERMAEIDKDINVNVAKLYEVSNKANTWQTQIHTYTHTLGPHTRSLDDQRLHCAPTRR